MGRHLGGGPAGEQVAVSGSTDRWLWTRNESEDGKRVCLHRVFQLEFNGLAKGWRCKWCKVNNIFTWETGWFVRPDEVGSSSLFWLRLRCPSHLCADIGGSCVKATPTQEITRSLILRLISHCLHNQLFRAVLLNMFDWKWILRILCNWQNLVALQKEKWKFGF